MDFLIVLLVGSTVVGLLSRRWIAVLLPLISVPLYFIGKNQEWWGCCGTGDGWQTGLVLLTIGGVAAPAIAVSLGRVLARLLGRTPDPPVENRCFG